MREMRALHKSLSSAVPLLLPHIIVRAAVAAVIMISLVFCGGEKDVGNDVGKFFHRDETGGGGIC